MELNTPKPLPIELDTPVGRTPNLAAPADHIHAAGTVTNIVMRSPAFDTGTGAEMYLIVMEHSVFLIKGWDAVLKQAGEYDKFDIDYVVLRL